MSDSTGAESESRAPLPAPRSHSAAGAAEEVAGSIGPRVTAYLPTATLRLTWHARYLPHNAEPAGVPLFRTCAPALPLPRPVVDALSIPALLGVEDGVMCCLL